MCFPHRRRQPHAHAHGRVPCGDGELAGSASASTTAPAHSLPASRPIMPSTCSAPTAISPRLLLVPNRGLCSWLCTVVYKKSSLGHTATAPGVSKKITGMSDIHGNRYCSNKHTHTASLVRDGQPSPHRPRLFVSRSTCPPLSPSPHANSFIKGTAEPYCKSLHTHTA